MNLQKTIERIIFTLFQIFQISIEITITASSFRQSHELKRIRTIISLSNNDINKKNRQAFKNMKNSSKFLKSADINKFQHLIYNKFQRYLVDSQYSNALYQQKIYHEQKKIIKKNTRIRKIKRISHLILQS